MTQHQHTEHSMLTRYLLTPSSLHTIITLKDFSALHKSKPNPVVTQALRKHYQDLHFQRSIDVDTVRLNIDRQCMRSGVLKARLRRSLKVEIDGDEDGLSGGRKRKLDHDKDQDDREDDVSHQDGLNQFDSAYDALNDPRERAMDAKFFGPTGAVLPSTKRRYHTTESLLVGMQQSVDSLEKEILQIETEADMVIKDLEETVGSLSDLRYGKFARVSTGADDTDTSVEAGVVAALKEVTNVANSKVRRTSRKKGYEP